MEIVEARSEPRVVEAEVVAPPRPASKGRRIAGRLVAAAALGVVGGWLILTGATLCLTIIGAIIGLPMMALGAALVFAAAVVPFLQGQVRVVTFGRAGRRA